jgi:hypothetical protein
MLKCVNCQKPTDPKDAQHYKFFAGVFCCGECFVIAERFFDKGTEDLKSLLVMLKESIRIALVQGRLKLGTPPPMRDTPKREVLEEILKLREKMDVDGSPPGAGHPPGQPVPTGRPNVPLRRVGPAGR